MQTKPISLNEYEQSKAKIHFSPNQQFYPEHLIPEAEAVLAAKGFPKPKPYTKASETVYQHYGFPFPPYDYQKAWVDAFAETEAAGMYLEVGLGKTQTATMAALYHRIQNPGHTLILMPPILIRQWDKWLRSIKGINSVLMYKGTPSERAAMNLDAEFVLMSLDIFKRDFDRLYDFFENRNVTLIVDEAVSVKNPATQNHKCVLAFHKRDKGIVDGKSRRKRPTPKPVSQAQVKADTSAVDKLKALLKDRYR